MISEKTFYLIPYLGVPGLSHPPSRQHIVEANKAAKVMGIQVHRIDVQSRNINFLNQRYFFRFPRYMPNDTKALRICECVLYGVEMSFGPFGDPDQPLPIIRVADNVIRSKKEVNIDDLEEGSRLVLGQVTTGASVQSLISSVSFIRHDRVAAAWKISRALFIDQNLYNASRFLYASQNDFFVYPGQINQAASLTEQVAESGWEQNILENAILNAFKVVEAVVGDPPSSDKKFYSKLRNIGVDPLEPVGYRDKKPIAEVIRDMNVVRDKKSAHGGTPDRDITVAEVLGNQTCAKYILIYAIENCLGERIW